MSLFGDHFDRLTLPICLFAHSDHYVKDASLINNNIFVSVLKKKDLYLCVFVCIVYGTLAFLSFTNTLDVLYCLSFY